MDRRGHLFKNKGQLVIMSTSKVFYLHTQPEYRIGSRCIGHRASIACAVEGDTIKFGYSICSRGDNFSRSVGRQLATERMEKGFGRIPFKNDWFEHFPTQEAALLEFATTLSRSIRKNFEKYKRKVATYTATKPAA